jgi:hypothetical protein
MLKITKLAGLTAAVIAMALAAVQTSQASDTSDCTVPDNLPVCEILVMASDYERVCCSVEGGFCYELRARVLACKSPGSGGKHVYGSVEYMRVDFTDYPSYCTSVKCKY